MGTENHSLEIFNDYNNKQCINFAIKNNSKSSKIISITNIDKNISTLKSSSVTGSVSSSSSSSHNKNINFKRTNSEDVPNIPITIDENNVIDGAKEILKVIRTDWKLNNVKFKFFTDGITNKLVGCFYNKSQLPLSKSSSSLMSSNSENESYNNSNNLVSTENSNENDTNTTNDDNTTNDVVLIRVYGNNTELLIDRKAEQRNIRLLHTYGFAPSLFATFKNGLAYEYVPGCTLTPLTVIQPQIWTLIAQRMAEMHKVKSPETIFNNTTNGDNHAVNNGCCNNDSKFEPMLWSKTQLLLKLIPEQFSDKIKHERVSKIFSSMTTLRKEFEDLYKILEKLESPLVFSHNDLLLGNVIYNKNSNSVTFIDYEYAAINFQGFDIGNHFAEFTGIEIDEIDYNRYPTKEFQMKWLNVYLKHYLNIDDCDDNYDNNIILKNSIDKLYVQSNQFALAAHLFWAIWGLVQAENSKIDFDFIKYSKIRYEEYLDKKDQFLSLKV